MGEDGAAMVALEDVMGELDAMGDELLASAAEGSDEGGTEPTAPETA